MNEHKTHNVAPIPPRSSWFERLGDVKFAALVGCFGVVFGAAINAFGPKIWNSNSSAGAASCMVQNSEIFSLVTSLREIGISYADLGTAYVDSNRLAVDKDAQARLVGLDIISKRAQEIVKEGTHKIVNSTKITDRLTEKCGW